MPRPVRLSLDEVVTRGAAEIQAVRDALEELVGDARARDVYWHPTGFIVLPLRDVDGLGLIRLHVWPAKGRVKREGNPEIHAHCFHLTSLVVAGTYIEHQFRAAEIPPDAAENFGFRVLPPSGDGVDRLLPDACGYRLETTRTLRTVVGEVHNLPANVHHMTDIPEGSTCATIALLSRPQPDAFDHLIGPASTLTEVSATRLPVDRSVLDSALSGIGL